MNPGDVVLLPMSQIARGAVKLRPGLVLSALPGPYQSLLVCGISSQLQLLQPNWDELVDSTDSDFAGSGLHRPSVIRFSYLHATDPQSIAGVIGEIDVSRLRRLLSRLSDHLRLAAPALPTP